MLGKRAAGLAGGDAKRARKDDEEDVSADVLKVGRMPYSIPWLQINCGLVCWASSGLLVHKVAQNSWQSTTSSLFSLKQYTTWTTKFAKKTVVLTSVQQFFARS